MVVVRFMMIVMVLQVLRVRTAAVVAFDPGFCAVGVDLFFPNRQAVLDVVDNVTSGQKSVAAVVCGDADPDGNVASRKWAETMHDGGVFDVEFNLGLFDNGLRDTRCELCIPVIVEFGDGLAFIVIAHPTFVAAVAARGERQQLFA